MNVGKEDCPRQFFKWKAAARMKGTKYHIHCKMKLLLLLSFFSSFLLSWLCSRCRYPCLCCFCCHFSCWVVYFCSSRHWWHGSTWKEETSNCWYTQLWRNGSTWKEETSNCSGTLNIDEMGTNVEKRKPFPCGLANIDEFVNMLIV